MCARVSRNRRPAAVSPSCTRRPSPWCRTSSTVDKRSPALRFPIRRRPRAGSPGRGGLVPVAGARRPWPRGRRPRRRRGTRAGLPAPRAAPPPRPGRIRPTGQREIRPAPAWSPRPLRTAPTFANQPPALSLHLGKR